MTITSTNIISQNSWESSILYYGDNDKLIYVSDAEGNRIPDFSYTGYKNSNEEIPFVDVVYEILPIEGDNTNHIQEAINIVGVMPIDANGFRGALLLKAGEYEVNGTVTIPYDGVILRGEGDEEDSINNTIIKALGDSPHQRSVIVAGGGNSSLWNTKVWASETNITSDTVFVGSKIFDVESAASYSVGDNIVIYHPCTEEWLEAIDYGGTHSGEGDAEPGVDVPWSVGSQPLLFNRYITDVSGNTITVDVPVFNHLIKDLSQSYIYKLNKGNVKSNIGIEDLRIDIEDNGEENEDHAWNAIDLYEIEDAWVKNCTFLHFGLSGVRTNTATRITVSNCNALDPKSIIEGGKRYNFNLYNGSQQILFEDCTATNGRHHYMSNGTTWTSGCAFVNCTSSGAYTSSEGHRRWSMGLLYDNHVELDGPRQGLNPRLLGLYNRGYYGTSHGWSLANSVAWNCDVANGDLIVQKPPTAQNYAIGCKGDKITGTQPDASFDEPEGFIEGSNNIGIDPNSLFVAQLNERKNIILGMEGENVLPANFRLEQNYPNPFNPITNITFALESDDQIKLSVFNSLGQALVSICSGYFEKGYYTYQFDASDYSSGIYFYQLTTSLSHYTQKMTLIK